MIVQGSDGHSTVTAKGHEVSPKVLKMVMAEYAKGDNWLQTHNPLLSPSVNTLCGMCTIP